MLDRLKFLNDNNKKFIRFLIFLIKLIVSLHFSIILIKVIILIIQFLLWDYDMRKNKIKLYNQIIELQSRIINQKIKNENIKIMLDLFFGIISVITLYFMFK